MTQPQRPRLPDATALAALPSDGGSAWNRLVFERSPYLLQHAANPVDWRPCGDEAFDAARRENKPVFLSIGYSTCHWCHVMEQESFEDDEVAAALNEAFVCIKVDREERPDVDAAYMTVTQALTGSGGWPMTVVLTPDRKPFFAGTYFPKRGRHGRPGVMDLVPMLSSAWARQRDAVVAEADRITDALADMTRSAPGAELGVEAIEAARDQLAARFDPLHGGFGRAPKFPSPHQLSLLLRWHHRSGDPHALAMVESTLDGLRRGGIFDHVGLGLHRYATDREWLVPHFEKMLYDQALLINACVDAWLVTGRDEHATFAREVATYVLRDMTSAAGGFFSAEDADSEGEEGKFTTWTAAEMRSLLGAEADFVMKAFGARDEGNFRDEATAQSPGTNILHLPRPLPELASTLGIEVNELRARLERARAILFAAREERIHPLKDDKILTDWNGLMIAALARGGAALGEPSWIDAARRAAAFVLENLRDADGRLLKRWRGGEAGLPAVLDDYAFMMWGLVELYQSTFEPRWLAAAVELAHAMLSDFHDDADGALFLTSVIGERLPVRVKESHDGALPSGNSVAALSLHALARLTGDSKLEDASAAILAALAGNVARMPSAHCVLLAALDGALGPFHEIVLVGSKDAPNAAEMLKAIRGRYLPRAVVLWKDPADSAAIEALAPFTVGMRGHADRVVAHACTGFACAAPTDDPRVLMATLDGG